MRTFEAPEKDDSDMRVKEKRITWTKITNP
jgi:hypothetical protein